MTASCDSLQLDPPSASLRSLERLRTILNRQPTTDELRALAQLRSPIPKPTATRATRYAVRDVLRHVTGLRRHQGCGRHRIRDRDVQLRLALEDGNAVAHYSGLQACGAIWTCPVCSPKIRQHRAVDADRACATWLAQHGAGALLLLTLTLPHDHGETLQTVLASTRAAFSALVSGRAWKADKSAYGVRHYIRAHDVTVGANGWHPHLHLLLFLDRALTAEQLQAFRDRLFHRWGAAVASLDRRAPSYAHGVKLEAARSRADAARYVCQVVAGDPEHAVPVAYELTRGDLKTSHHAGQRTPWQVLADYGDGHRERDRQLWLEYERATRRVNAIRWSVGLRRAVQLDTPELSDEQIALAEVGGDVLLTFTREQWRTLRDAAGFFDRTARSELLDAAELDGLAGVTRYLQLLERRQALDRAERPVYAQCTWRAQGPPGTRSRLAA